MINLKDLCLPFPPQDVEWRLQECGKKNDKIWAMCLAYITNRAIMQRLDDVCGPENWKNEYQPGPQGGVICGISIRCVDGWVTKWDGADNTQVEATKGGLSDAMKRAGVQWGIGRYLYKLEANFAEIVPEGKKGEYRGKTKDGTYFQWNSPKLPAWALPDTSPPKQEQQQREAPPPPDEPPPKQEGKKLSEAQTRYFPRCKAALDTLHGSDIAAKKATIKANSGIPAKGNYPAKEGVEDYRTLDGDRLKYCCHALEKLAEKQQPTLCADCRQPVSNHAPSCPQAQPPIDEQFEQHKQQQLSTLKRDMGP